MVYTRVLPLLVIFFSWGLVSCHSPASMSAFEAASGKPLQVVIPTTSPAPGFYPTTQTVSLSSTTAGAQIRYTLDGSSPTAGLLYTGAFSIAVNQTLRAQAFKSGFPDSTELSGYYQIGAASPSFQVTVTDLSGVSKSVNPGTSYTANNDMTNVQILYISQSGGNDGQSIYYTTDGSDPTDSANAQRHLYTLGTNLGPLTSGQTLGLRAYAAVGGWNPSPEVHTTLAVVYTDTRTGVTGTPLVLTLSGSTTVSLSSGGTFTVTAKDYSGNVVTPSSIQWYLNSLAVSGGTGASLTIDSETEVGSSLVTLAAGVYTLTCVVNGSYSQGEQITVTN